ncbi:hypothetical protein DFH11DRAFT_1053368 [Phellopilus nigrolimitatus]|nr:hypothetical protein DFH11DRAFT_1053368 [Phellopilus nigrolimitatus]
MTDKGFFFLSIFLFVASLNDRYVGKISSFTYQCSWVRLTVIEKDDTFLFPVKLGSLALKITSSLAREANGALRFRQTTTNDGPSAMGSFHFYSCVLYSITDILPFFKALMGGNENDE